MIKATITMDTGAQMVFELFAKKAPITVASFADVANSGFFDGLEWCRVVEGYVIQSGSPDNDIMTDSDFHLVGEFKNNGYDTGIDHRRGALSMARDDDPNTAGTQFFVVHQPAHQLDGRYAAFGYMITGYEELDRIAIVDTNGKENWNHPLNPPIIQTIRVTTDGEALPSIERLP